MCSSLINSHPQSARSSHPRVTAPHAYRCSTCPTRLSRLASLVAQVRSPAECHAALHACVASHVTRSAALPSGGQASYWATPRGLLLELHKSIIVLRGFGCAAKARERRTRGVCCVHARLLGICMQLALAHLHSNTPISCEAQPHSFYFLETSRVTATCGIGHHLWRLALRQARGYVCGCPPTQARRMPHAHVLIK